MILALLLLTVDDARALLDRFAHEPGVDALVAAAVREADLDPQRARSWMKRARIAPWLPEAGVRVDRDTAYDETWDDGPTGARRRIDADSGVGWRVHASWDLGRLVFEPNELAVAREGASRVELRARIVREVVQLYFERRRLQAEALIDPASEGGRALEREVRVREIEAALDAMTGGAMTHGRAVGRPRAGAHVDPRRRGE